MKPQRDEWDDLVGYLERIQIDQSVCRASYSWHPGRYHPEVAFAQMQNVNHREQAPLIAADLEKELAHVAEGL